MFYRGKITWSPVEEEYLKKNRKTIPINQLTIALGKSRNAIKLKLDEFDGKPAPVKKNKKSRIGKRKDLDSLFLRSGWEANCLRYLKYMKKKYEYEIKIFLFDKIKRGKLTYTPDIYLPEDDIFIEVKGQLHPGDKGRLRNFKKYYPQDFSKLYCVVGSSKTKSAEYFKKLGIPVYFYYNDIKKAYSKIIPHWE